MGTSQAGQTPKAGGGGAAHHSCRDAPRAGGLLVYFVITVGCPQSGKQEGRGAGGTWFVQRRTNGTSGGCYATTDRRSDGCDGRERFSRAVQRGWTLRESKRALLALQQFLDTGKSDLVVPAMCKRRDGHSMHGIEPCRLQAWSAACHFLVCTRDRHRQLA